MAAMPKPVAGPAESFHLLTIAEYAELGETEWGYTELIEGRLLMSPSPVPDHNIAIGELFVSLRPAVPSHLRVIQDIDIDLQLAPAAEPGASRRPDLVVVDQAEIARVRAHGGLLRASEVLLVIEVVSPGSRRTDHVDKRRDYADAGIPYYWIVDLDDPASVLACHLTEEFGYQDDQTATGRFTTDVPFPVGIELATLLTR